MKNQYSLFSLMTATLVVACILAYVFRPLREVIYISEGNYNDRSNTVEFVESGRRMRVDMQGVTGDKFKVQSWAK